MNAKGDGAEFTAKRKTKPLSGSEKLAALQKASGFKSKLPFVKILIQPSYITRTNGIVSYVLQTFDKNLINEKIFLICFLNGKESF